MKKLLIVVLVLAAVGAIGAYVLVGNLDRIVGDVIETAGSRATRATVTVDSVDLQVMQGSGTITGVTVGNPEGFETPRAFALGTISVELEPKTLTETPIVVRRVTIDSCDVTYEWQLGGSNMARIEENVREYAAGDRSTQAAEEDGEPARVVIRELVVEGGHIEVAASVLGGQTVGVPLDRIVLRDVGANEGGATAAGITTAVLGALTSGVLEAVAGAGIDELGGAQDAGEKILEGAKDILDGVIGK